MTWNHLNYVLVSECPVPVQQQDREDRALEGGAAAADVVLPEEQDRQDRELGSPQEAPEAVPVQQPDQRRREPGGADDAARFKINSGAIREGFVITKQ